MLMNSLQVLPRRVRQLLVTQSLCVHQVFKGIGWLLRCETYPQPKRCHHRCLPGSSKRPGQSLQAISSLGGLAATCCLCKHSRDSQSACVRGLPRTDTGMAHGRHCIRHRPIDTRRAHAHARQGARWQHSSSAWLGCSPTLSGAAGLVTSWPAASAWVGKAGVARLSQLAGSVHVQVMQSADGRYNGSLQQRSSSTVPFEEVLQALGTEESSAAQSRHLYLAQSTMWASSQPAAPLAPLLVDIETPACLRSVGMQHINLWLSTRRAALVLHAQAATPKT